MRIDVHDFLTREYPRENFNCWDFARTVWFEASGEDIGLKSPDTVKRYREALEAGENVFRLIPKPKNPCFIKFFDEKRILTPHIGIYYNRKVLHYKKEGVLFSAIEDCCQELKLFNYYEWVRPNG